MDGREVVGLDEQLAGVRESHPEYILVGQKGTAQLSGLLCVQFDSMRMLVEQFSNGVKIPEGEKSAIVQNQNLLSDALDFVQRVAAYQNGLAHRAKLSNDIHDGRSSEWITTGERLVQDDEVRVMDHRVGDFHPLSHPLAVFANLLVDDILQADELQNVQRPFLRLISRVSIEASQSGDEVEPGHPVVELL